jgi:hypothetical protein
MSNYRYTQSAALSAERVFDYLADVRNLPRYLPSMTVAEPEGGDQVHVEAKVDGRTEAGEAWMRVDREHWRIEWGSEGPNDYHGELEIAGCLPCPRLFILASLARTRWPARPGASWRPTRPSMGRWRLSWPFRYSSRSA